MGRRRSSLPGLGAACVGFPLTRLRKVSGTALLDRKLLFLALKTLTQGPTPFCPWPQVSKQPK